jgi:NAD(P)H-dependent FMN reductase
MEKATIGVIVGSTREGRFSEYPAQWIVEYSKKFENLSLSLIDLRDHSLPFLEDAKNPSHMGGVYENPGVAKWAETIKRHDGYIMVTPEYNRSTSGVLKNALDHIYGEFAKKPVGFIAYGSVGGARAVEQLRLMAVEHQMAPIRNGIHIMAPWFMRNEDGSLRADALTPYEKAADTMLEEIAWWAHTLKAARV